jgi:hypothetical protein
MGDDCITLCVILQIFVLGLLTDVADAITLLPMVTQGAKHMSPDGPEQRFLDSRERFEEEFEEMQIEELEADTDYGEEE